MPPKASLELRVYRYISVCLLATMTGVAGYVANAAMQTTSRLPAIEIQLSNLNKNLEALSGVPSEVMVLKFQQSQMNDRLANIERKRSGG